MRMGGGGGGRGRENVKNWRGKALDILHESPGSLPGAGRKIVMFSCSVLPYKVTSRTGVMPNMSLLSIHPWAGRQAAGK